MLSVEEFVVWVVKFQELEDADAIRHAAEVVAELVVDG